MNIFFLQKEPRDNPKLYMDCHVIKMTLETAQLLCAAHHMLLEKPAPDIYKLTHKNHPCAIWVRQTPENYEYAFWLFHHLLREYKFRFDKTHKCKEKIPSLSFNPVSQKCISVERNLFDEISMVPLAMPDKFKLELAHFEKGYDLHTSKVYAFVSYRRYYKHKFITLSRNKYTKRTRPIWLA